MHERLDAPGTAGGVRNEEGNMIQDIEALRAKYGVREYPLPGWEPGEDFIAKLRRPSLTDMTAVAGYVPNPLMGVIADMFMPTAKKVSKIPQDQQAKALQAMAKFALVEPTYDQLTEAGISLTDQQYNAIYTFTLGGATALARFRKFNGLKPGGDGADVPNAPVAPGGD